MATAEDVHSTLPLIWQRHVNRLKASLKRCSLLIVIDDALSLSTFKLDQSRLSGRAALRISLGKRNQSDGTTVAVWAYISDDRTGSEPPIVFRDEVPVFSKGVTTTRLYPRSASSLLRKARQVRPPFCFLQQELDEGVKDGRGMLCAVVAYYALTAGWSDWAIQWPRFDACLIAALNYINTVGTTAQTTKQEIQHETVSEMTVSAATMISLNSASTRKAPTLTASLYITPEVEGDAGQPTGFGDKTNQHNTSLIVKLKLDREAVAEITQVTLFVEVLERQDEATGFDADERDSGIDDGVDSVIGEDVDTVIGGTIDDVIVTAN